ncbi:Type 1 glutamine amidotransferase-like domain-containing protein [soil metagenome]
MTSPIRIYAVGGGSFNAGAIAIHRRLLALTGKPKPRVCFIPTASGDEPEYIRVFHEWMRESGAEGNVYTLTRPSEGIPREQIPDHDIIYVGGGNTARMLELWRGRGFDRLIVQGAERGAILSGTSAGMNCWFDCCVTDSFGPLRELMDGLGLIKGSACPHIDTEPERMPTLRRLLAEGFPAGYALDDGAAIYFEDGILKRAYAENAETGLRHVSLLETGIHEVAVEAEVLGG